MALTGEQLERYSRHIILKEIGLRGQKKLLGAKVLIIGAGGLGSPAAMYLAAAGVGTIGIADGDEVELSNLQRQILHGIADVGRPKTDSARETVEALNPDVRVIAHRLTVSAKNVMELIAPYDFIIDCTDNFAAKFLINDACVLAGKPFSHGAVVRFYGQLLTYVPGKGPCYRCAFREPPPPGSVPTCREAGVIGAAAGMIGCMQALEAVKYITGVGELLTGRLMIVDALSMETQSVALAEVPGCPVCGKHPTILAPFDAEAAACDLQE